MAKREPVAWITVNGVHVPIFEGESKDDAVKRSIKQSQDNIKANETQKEKDIAKNKAEKDQLNNEKIIGAKDFSTTMPYNDYEGHRIYKVTKKDYVVYKDGEKGTLVHEKTLKEAKARVDELKKVNADTYTNQLTGAKIKVLQQDDKSVTFRIGNKGADLDTVNPNNETKTVSKDSFEKMISSNKYEKDKDTKTKGSLSDASAGKASDEAREVKKESTSIPASHVHVDGEDYYRWANGKRPSGTGTWAFEIGGEEVWIYGSYTEAKKEAKQRAAKKGLFGVKVLS